MTTTTPLHLEFWNQVLEVGIYKYLLSKPFKENGIRSRFIQKPNISGIFKRRSSSIMTIELLKPFYKDFISTGKGNTLYEILKTSLQTIWDFEKGENANWLKNVLELISAHPINKIQELLPHKWKLSYLPFISE